MPPTPKSPIPMEVGDSTLIPHSYSMASSSVATSTVELAATRHHHQHSVVPTTAPLVQHCQHLLQPNGSILGRAVADCILPQFPDLLSAIPVSNRPALRCGVSRPARSPLSHSDIRQFLLETGAVLHQHWKLGRGHRVAVVLPNGPELALAILAVSCYCTVVPLNAFGAVNELEADLRRAAVDAVLALGAHP